MVDSKFLFLTGRFQIPKNEELVPNGRFQVPNELVRNRESLTPSPLLDVNI